MIYKKIFNHSIGIIKRFPILPKDIIESSWSGIVSRTEMDHKYLRKLIRIYLLLDAIMVLELV